MAVSEPKPMREWRCYVHDMVGCCERVLKYAAGFDHESLVAERRRYDAVRYNLIVLGEAVINVPETVRTRHREVPWREFVACRNRLVHGYAEGDSGVVWRTIVKDIRPLRTALRDLLATEPA